MRLVAVDWATSCPPASSKAPAASAPSWIQVLWEERTTTMLASSTATAKALRITSAVMVSSTRVTTSMPVKLTDAALTPSVRR